MANGIIRGSDREGESKKRQKEEMLDEKNTTKKRAKLIE